MKNQISFLAASLILGLSFIIGCLIISNERSASSKRAAESQITRVQLEAQTEEKKLQFRELQATVDKPMLTLQEAAILLGISEDQVMNIIKAEHSILSVGGYFNGSMLPYVKIDEQFLINKAGLLDWIQSATSEKRVYSGVKMVK